MRPSVPDKYFTYLPTTWLRLPTTHLLPDLWYLSTGLYRVPYLVVGISPGPPVGEKGVGEKRERGRVGRGAGPSRTRLLPAQKARYVI